MHSYASRSWLALSFDEDQAAFEAQRFSSDIRDNQFIVVTLRAAAAGTLVQSLDSPSLLSLGAPDHTRLRKPVNHGFYVCAFLHSNQPPKESAMNIRLRLMLK
jgi:cytochrome P450